MYHADDWIFHTSATVLITGQTMKTSEVETYSEWNKTDNNSNGVYENVSHIDEIDKKVSKAQEKAFDDLAGAALSASRKRGK